MATQDTKPDIPTPVFWSWVLISAVLFLVVWLAADRGGEAAVQEIAYSEFKTLLREGRVAELTLTGERASGRLSAPRPLGPQAVSSDRFRTHVPAFGDEQLLPLLEAQEVAVTVRPAPATRQWGGLLFLLPWVLVAAVMFALYRRGGGQLGGSSGMGPFLESASKPAKIPDISFADVAGQENAKREVQELIEFLRREEDYQRLGAQVPRGILLMGPPGTGKTLLAKALAGEAGVPFFSASASEFIEVFVGVGASRVRKLFEAAKQAAPAIIFIDELDSVGRIRGSGFGGGNDEREQTLNQILAEMDGFSGHEAVIVLAATNRPDVLDPALLRPGRFDRHVTLDLPERADREALLAVHTRRVPLDPEIDLGAIAAGTPGFSGADLKNIVNEAAMMAARERCPAVTMRHFDEARDRLLLGSARTLAIQPEERHRLAVHEAGHTAAAFFLPHADPLYKVTIIPRGRALGGTQQLPEAERHTLSEEYLRDRLAVMLGGRAAEQELLGSVSSGADDDIRQATNLARAMVGRWGMAPEIGPMDLRESSQQPFLGRELAQPHRLSERSADRVDCAVQDLLLEAEARARAIMQEHRPRLDCLIAQLERQELLTRAEIDRCLGTPNEPGNKSRQAAS